MTVLLRLVPLLLAWGVMVLALGRASTGSRKRLLICTIVGFVAGAGVGILLLSIFKGETPFGLVKGVTGGGFLLLWGWAVASIYRATGAMTGASKLSSMVESPLFPAFSSLVVGVLCLGRVFPQGETLSLVSVAVLIVSGISVTLGALAFERALPQVVWVSRETLPVLVVATILFISSCMPRFDLFSPLTMKVMKFIHDFIHQFFESMLIPDHPFFRVDVWGYIGLLFSKEVGFWGGLVIWFVPVILVALSVRLERLPSVAHIRQGAQRRKLLASFIRDRNRRQLVPFVSFLVLAGAVYQSRFPSVEYWNPKPLPVSANGAGQIIIPKKGEANLGDGKIHKYLFKQGGREARFFVLMTPTGRLTVTLDACAICQPDGYGQAEGTVICYYCKTLIPLETVGKPGGCNPVPVAFAEQPDSVTIDGASLLNSWTDTVQATTRIKGEGK